MKISSKGRYAVEVMVALAKSQNAVESVSSLSSTQGIPPKYLEQIIGQLVKAKKVSSSRGANGGYKLVKSPAEYTIAEILLVTGDLKKVAPCLSGEVSCPKKSSCEAVGCWETLDGLIYSYLNSLTLQNLVDKSYK